ncbi:MAG: HAD hydrolase-like protein [Actinomycetaceae bacterium]|nr:HAD hydrolase-like protein [Actinomycetaceae bacterium]
MKHLIWDMGGTLVDTYPDVVSTLCLAAYGDTQPEHMRTTSALTFHSTARAIETLAASCGVPQSRLERAYEDLKERWRTEPAPAMDGARELIDCVRQRGGLNLVATHRDRDSATILLTQLGLDVDDMICAPDGIERKPSPAMNLMLARRHGLAPLDVLCVGDRSIDAASGQAAGMNSALLIRPGTVLTLNHAVPGTLIVANLRDLIPFF